MTEDTSFIDPHHLIELVKLAKAAKSGMEEISGEFGKRVKVAKDNDALHTGAFRMACKIKREYDKDRRRGDAFREHLNYMLDELEKAGEFGESHVGDFDHMARRAVSEEADRLDAHDAAEAHVEGNVRLLKSGIKTLTEDVEFGDAPAAAPSRRGRKPAVEEVTKAAEPIGGDAPGTYSTH